MFLPCIPKTCPPKRDANPQVDLLDQWTVQGRQVSFFLNEESHFQFSIDGRKPEDIKPHLFLDDQRARIVARLFRNVIAENLAICVTPSAFVPIFESSAYTKEGDSYTRLRPLVALFGQENPETHEIIGARWGIYTSSGVTSIAARVEGLVAECLVNVICRGQTVKLYSEHVRPIATLDAEGKIQSIALEALKGRASLYDPRVPLDEMHWAITLISAQPGFSCDEEGIGGSSGHAMIAFEGVEDGFPFLKYAHLTKKKGFQGTVKMKSDFIDENAILQGPTWARPKPAVENMLTPIKKAADDRQSLPFAPGRQIPALVGPPLGVGGVAVGGVALGFAANAALDGAAGALISSVIPTGVVAGATVPASLSSAATLAVIGSVGVAITSVAAAAIGIGSLALQSASRRYDCIRWVLEQFPRGGIRLKLPSFMGQSRLFTPNGVVRHLNKHPQAVIFYD